MLQLLPVMVEAAEVSAGGEVSNLFGRPCADSPGVARGAGIRDISALLAIPDFRAFLCSLGAFGKWGSQMQIRVHCVGDFAEVSRRVWRIANRSQVTDHFWVQNTYKTTLFNQNVTGIPMHCALNADCISLFMKGNAFKSEIQPAFRAQCIGIAITF